MRMGLRIKILSPLILLMLVPICVSLLAGYQVGDRPVFIMVLGIIAVLSLPVYACAIYLLYIVSSRILRPLRELGNAAQALMEGNYRVPVSYSKNDEMGDLCKTFTIMRLRLEDSLRRQAESEQARKDLIASLSHDLRTPMSSIKGYVEGLEDGVIHDEKRLHRYVSVIKAKTESLDRLIERLFLYSQSDLKESMGCAAIYHSEDLLEDLLAPYELEFEAQPLRLSIQRPFPSVQLRTNAEDLAHVFDNLIGNAARYARTKIEVRAELCESTLKLFVSDDGDGIRDGDLPYIFQQFYRAEGARSGGAGLGLAICKKLIERQGGEIWVASTSNQGTTFCFSLPVMSAPPD